MACGPKKNEGIPSFSFCTLSGSQQEALALEMIALERGLQ